MTGPSNTENCGRTRPAAVFAVLARCARLPFGFPSPFADTARSPHARFLSLSPRRPSSRRELLPPGVTETLRSKTSASSKPACTTCPTLPPPRANCRFQRCAPASQLAPVPRRSRRCTAPAFGAAAPPNLEEYSSFAWRYSRLHSQGKLTFARMALEWLP